METRPSMPIRAVTTLLVAVPVTSIRSRCPRSPGIRNLPVSGDCREESPWLR
jgi:hypothetical protein